MNKEEKRLFINKKIKDIEVNGYEVVLILEDNIQLIYDATDNGFSTYRIITLEEQIIEELDENENVDIYELARKVNQIIKHINKEEK